MTGITFTTDFSRLVESLSKERNTPGLHLLNDLDNPKVIAQVSHDLVALMMASLSKDERTVQAAVTDAEQLLSFLNDHLKTLQRDISRSKSLMAPIRRLPVEVLQEIFLQANATFHRFSWRFGKNPPPNTSQVNRHWRDVALGIPRLWTTAFVTLGTRDSTSQVNTLKLIFERSRPLPVSLVLDAVTSELGHYYEAGEDDGDDDDLNDYEYYARERRRDELEELIYELNDAAADLAVAIAPYLSQIGTVTISQYSDGIQYFLDYLRENCGEVEASLTQLKFLAVPGHHWEGDPKLLFNSAPNLERLLLYRKDGMEATVTSIPWNKLKAFRGEIPETEVAALFASGTKSLQVAELSVRKLPPRPSGKTVYAPLQNLTSLYLKVISLPKSSKAIPPLPSLRHCLLQPDSAERYNRTNIDRSKPPTDLKPRVLALLKAWGPRLRYFGLNLSTLSDTESLALESIHDIIATVPNLEAIALPSDWFTELDNIMPRLPRLSHVEVLATSDKLSFLRRETKGKGWSPATLSRLRTLTFLTCESSMMEDAKQKAGEFGLRVSISSRNQTEKMQFMTPYFTRQGGLFRQAIVDDDIPY